MTQKQKFILLAIILLAVFFRFYQIAQMPGGLFPDMAANGLDVNLMQQGHIQPFYERGNGREALFFYMEWASVALFGKGVWQFSIVSALFGVLAVLACFLAAREIFLLGFDDEKSKRRAVNIALLAAFLMAVNSWHVVLSRTAFRATLIPFFSAMTVYFLLRTYRAGVLKAKFWSAVLAGVFFALGFYTYIAFRIMAPILFMVLLWPMLASIRQAEFVQTLKRYFWLAGVSAIAFTVVIFPLARYFYHDPAAFVGRAGQVSVFNPSLYTIGGVQLSGKPALPAILPVIAEVGKTQLLGFFIQGDLNWRQNISGYPFLSPLVSPFFGIGFILVTLLGIWYFFAPNKRKNFWKYFLLTGWFWGMLLPVVTTAEGIPHGLRGIGVIPVIFIITAWVMYEFGERIYALHKRIWEKCWCHPQSPIPLETVGQGVDLAHESHPHFRRFKFINSALEILVVCFCAALILQTYFLYFVYAYNSPENFYYFRSDLTPVSQYLVNRCNKENTYLILDKFSVQTTDYLTSDPKGNFNSPCNVPYLQVDPERAYQLSGLKPGDEIVFTQSSIFDTKKFKQYHPEARLSLEVRNKFNQAVMGVYQVH